MTTSTWPVEWAIALNTEVKITELFSIFPSSSASVDKHTPPREIQKVEPRKVPDNKDPISTRIRLTEIMDFTPSTFHVISAMILARPTRNTPNNGGIIAVSRRFRAMAIADSSARYVRCLFLCSVFIVPDILPPIVKSQ